jgi:hypothetical protein
MISTQKKKKKVASSEEEERLKALLKKPVDVATLNNDLLRPWTVNPGTEKILTREISKLDKTIIITSPQMSAGDIGYSVLDRKAPEIEDFHVTMKNRSSFNPHRTIYDNFLFTYHNPKQPYHPSRENNRTKNNGIASSSNEPSDCDTLNGAGSGAAVESASNNFSGNYISNSGRRGGNPRRNSDDDMVSEVDEDHISKVQRMILSKAVSHQHHLAIPLPTVHYKPFKSPAVFPLSTSEYQKMRNDVGFSPIRSQSSLHSHLNPRNQKLLMSIVNSNHPQEIKPELDHSKLFHSRRIRQFRATTPDIKSSYFHFPPPTS